MATYNYIYTIASHKFFKAKLCGVGLALILLAPVYDGYDAIDIGLRYFGKISGHSDSVNAIDNPAFRRWKTIGAVGVVYYGKRYVAMV